MIKYHAHTQINIRVLSHSRIDIISIKREFLVRNLYTSINIESVLGILFSRIVTFYLLYFKEGLHSLSNTPSKRGRCVLDIADTSLI